MCVKLYDVNVLALSNKMLLFLLVSLEAMETHVRENATATNMQPVKAGVDKCEAVRASLENFHEHVRTTCVKFVLHPLLASILENKDTFCLGQSLIMDSDNQIPTGDTISAEPDFPSDVDDEYGISPRREVSQDPLRTSFIRSNSSKLITLPGKLTGTDTGAPNTRQNSQLSMKPGMSRQNSKANIDLNAKSRVPSRMNSKTDFSNVSRKNSMVGLAAKQVEKPSKLLLNKHGKKSESKPLKDPTQTEYKEMVGLKATLAYRSSSAPLINMQTSTGTKPDATMSTIKEEKSMFTVTSCDTLETKTHATGCYITGIVVMAGGAVVMCDTVHDSLQLYDPQHNFVGELECPHPWGVAAVSENVVAVSLHYDHRLILVKTNPTLERLNEKDIVLKCNAALTYDVKFYAYRLYVLCIDGDVHVLDLKGKEYKVIKTGLGQNSAKYFDIDVDHDVFVIAGDKSVTCTLRGMPLWSFKTQSGKSKVTCTGVAIHKERVLVNDWDNFRLTEMVDGGRKLQTVHGEGLERPLALCVAPGGGAVYISQADYDMAPEKTRLVRVLSMATAEE